LGEEEIGAKAGFAGVWSAATTEEGTALEGLDWFFFSREVEKNGDFFSNLFLKNGTGFRPVTFLGRRKGEKESKEKRLVVLKLRNDWEGGGNTQHANKST
jgi:hypothetical protein